MAGGAGPRQPAWRVGKELLSRNRSTAWPPREAAGRAAKWVTVRTRAPSWGGWRLLLHQVRTRVRDWTSQEPGRSARHGRGSRTSRLRRAVTGAWRCRLPLVVLEPRQDARARPPRLRQFQPLLLGLDGRRGARAVTAVGLHL